MISSDSPISDPTEDQFGIDDFAKAIAKAIDRPPAPDGTVIALTGPWGSGKSSAVNLIRHHLKPIEESDELKILTFNPWWYSDEPTLTRAFFQHLYAGLGGNISRSGRKLILSLGKKLLGAGPLVSSVADLLTFGIWGKLVPLISSSLADAIKTDRTSEQEQGELSDLLRKQPKKYLIVIDDIDRLTPEQTLSIFRLVKSIGRLPNVIYLLVFDRELAQKLLAEKYPSERHFLEKIVQAAFEMPLPDPSTLQESLLRTLVGIMGHPDGQDGIRFRNVLTDVVNPLVQLPRDLARLLGNISVSWAAIGEEVDAADLIAIEAIRLFCFDLHQRIRTSKDILCGTSDDGSRSRDLAGPYNERLLSFAKTDAERTSLQTALRRLFPRLDSVWSNMHYDGSTLTGWYAKRRICHPSSFSSYFKLTIGDDLLPKRIVRELLDNADDEAYVQEFFRRRSTISRKNGKSEIPLVFDELMGLPTKIPGKNLLSLLGGLFAVMDEIDLAQDEEKGGFSIGNQLRLQWLLNEFVRDKLSQSQRNVLFRKIFPKASLDWSIDLMRRLHDEHFPRSPDRNNPLKSCLVGAEVESELRSLTMERLQDAAQSGALLASRHLLSVLYRWREFLGDEHYLVRMWTDTQLNNDAFLFRMIQEITSTVWRSSIGWDGMGDRVSQGIPYVQLQGLDTIIDVDRFLARIENIDLSTLNDEQKAIVERYYEGERNRTKEQGGL